MNKFKLFRLPEPRSGHVLGLVGTNGIGKTTALRILTTKLKPNLGEFDDPPSWSDIIAHFKGNELQNYFQRSIEDDFKTVMKPQYVDQIPKVLSGLVKNIIEKKDERKVQARFVKLLDIESTLEKDLQVLSGGELQRFAILIAILQKADVYMFDEPTSYLDVKQRLTISNVIRDMVSIEDKSKYVIVVEHDLSILDYMSDYV